MADTDSQAELCKSEALQSVFFENTEYIVEVEFHTGENAVEQAKLIHPRFHDEKDTEQEVTKDTFMKRRQMLSFPLNYGNEIGRSHIDIIYNTVGGEIRHIILHYDVMSVKLDYHSDLRSLLYDIEREYAMLSLDFLRMTYHTFAIDADAEQTPDLIWWNLFRGVQQEFCAAASMIIDRPHNRLRRNVAHVRADRLKMVTPSLERELAMHAHEERHLYLAETWELNDDTPENRFLKFALQQTTERFKKLKHRIENLPRKSLPKDYTNQLEKEEETLERLSSSPFLRRIGKFNGLKGENLTLKQAAGYSTVYRDWLLLQNTYDLHDGILNMELKDIATLYEIWCFIKVKNIVRELLGENITQLQPSGAVKPDFILKLEHGKESRVILKGGDVELAEVIYNAQLGRNGKGGMSGMGDTVGSLTVEQRPDIVLRLTKQDIATGLKMTYLFDAKYRLEDDQTPPDDAINQMHRYRDAIYYSETAYKDGWTANPHDLKKEVIGGYILFPGEEPSEGENPDYISSLAAVNIGAFPLRPSADKSKERTLRAFLREIIDLKTPFNALNGCIPQKGLEYTDKPVMRGSYFLSSIDGEVNDDRRAVIEGRANEFFTGRYTILSNIDFQKIRYFAPIDGHDVKGYYHVTGVKVVDMSSHLAKSAKIGSEGQSHPYRIRLSLGTYVKLNNTLIYGFHNLSPKGVTLTRDDFMKLKKKKSSQT